ncbi:hypothetical protein LMJF_22_1690 [Leishmania major strain Friedlin]|uniref:Uncharacterized protein n=1 Tax=Leishmania major TaxID=5664 RepID=Q4QBH8_LEIMA|nr:hypothetical protein LMJF_22_1690 [Leishmania major strain Friedlin]CAJ04955.1 hypothetical protein LMJF_22_1690 [Leishmania major strain Friedlin]|eukprot:XP_001683320.1 hypothetical protein LMJF_22_1690 [Leishmania major strain Friedlin]
MRKGSCIVDVAMPPLTSCAVIFFLLVCVLWRMEDGVELCAVGLVSCFHGRAFRMAMRISLFLLHAFLVFMRAYCPLGYTLLCVAGGLVVQVCVLLSLSLSLGMRALRSSCPAFLCWQALPSTTPLLREIRRHDPPSTRSEQGSPDSSNTEQIQKASHLDSHSTANADHSQALPPAEAVPPLTADTLRVPQVRAECPPDSALLSPGNGLTPTLAECASNAAPQPSEAAPVLAADALPPTPAECAPDAAPQPSEAAPVLAADTLPPTPAECASNAAPQPSEKTAPKRDASAPLPRKREREGACDSSFWPLKTRRALDAFTHTAARQPSEAALLSAVDALPPTPAECAPDAAPQPSEAAPVSAADALPPTPAECAPDAGPQPSEAALVSAVDALPPTPAECAPDAEPQPSEAAPVSAVDALPPTPAECAPDAAPQPSEAAPVSAADALPPTPAECAPDAAPQPSEAAPVLAVDALPPTPAECAPDAEPQPSEAAPVLAADALPPTPAECAPDAAPQPSEAAPVLAVDALPPTPAECAPDAEPQPSEAAPVLAVDALPPTPAECAPDAEPQPSEAAPVSAVDALPPTPAECAPDAALQPSEAAGMFAGKASPRMHFARNQREEVGSVFPMRWRSAGCKADAERAAAFLAAAFGEWPTRAVSLHSCSGKVGSPAWNNVSQPSEAAPVLAADALPPTPAECAPDAAPQPSEAAGMFGGKASPRMHFARNQREEGGTVMATRPLSTSCRVDGPRAAARFAAVFGGLPTLELSPAFRCPKVGSPASNNVPRPSEAAPVLAVDALPPTPAECAPDAAPELGDSAPVSVSHTRPPTPAECAPDAAPELGDSAPVSVSHTRPPTPAECAPDAGPELGDSAPVSVSHTRPPTPAECAPDAGPELGDSAPVSVSHTRPPTPAECAPDAGPELGDSAPVSVSHTRPPTPAECAPDAGPELGDSAPVSVSHTRPPTPAECAPDAGPELGDSAPVSVSHTRPPTPAECGHDFVPVSTESVRPMLSRGVSAEAWSAASSVEVAARRAVTPDPDYSSCHTSMYAELRAALDGGRAVTTSVDRLRSQAYGSPVPYAALHESMTVPPTQFDDRFPGFAHPALYHPLDAYTAVEPDPDYSSCHTSMYAELRAALDGGRAVTTSVDRLRSQAYGSPVPYAALHESMTVPPTQFDDRFPGFAHPALYHPLDAYIAVEPAPAYSSRHTPMHAELRAALDGGRSVRHVSYPLRPSKRFAPALGAAPQPSEAAPVLAVDALPPMPAECASDAAPELGDSAPVSVSHTRPPTPAECAPDAGPELGDSAPVSVSHTRPPTPAECAPDAAPELGDSAPVSVSHTRPPTPAECAPDAAPQPSEAARPLDETASLRRKRPRDDASDYSFWPRRRRFSRPLRWEPVTVPPVKLPQDTRRALRASAQTAVRRPSEAAPVSAADALPPTPAECASDAAPELGDSAPVSLSHTRPPTPAECAPDAGPQPSEAVPVLAVDALPPTPAECASDAAPELGDSAPVSLSHTRPPTPAECAPDAAPQPSEAVPVLAVDALPPTPAECAPDAAPQPSEAARPLDETASLRRKRPRDDASDYSFWPRRRRFSRPLRWEPVTVPPVKLPHDTRRALRASAQTAVRRPSEAAPVLAVDALPPTPAECAPDAGPQPSEAALVSVVDVLPPTPAECAPDAAPQPSEAAPVLAADALPPTPAECAPDAGPQPSEAALVSVVDALPPTPAECAPDAAPQPSEAALVSVVDVLPPTPAECAPDAGPQPSEAAPVLAADALPPTPAECASDAAPELGDSAPVSLSHTRPPTPAECAPDAAPQPSEAVPVLAVYALPPTPAECAPDAGPQPSEAALVSVVDALPPTPAECAPDAAPQPSEAALVSVVDALPPTPAECAPDAAPQPSEAALVSVVDALPPTPAECAPDAGPQPSEAAPVLAVEAPCCMWRRSVRDLASDHMVARRRRSVLRRVKTSRRSNRRSLGARPLAGPSRSHVRDGWQSVLGVIRRWKSKAFGLDRGDIVGSVRGSEPAAGPQPSEAAPVLAADALPLTPAECAPDAAPQPSEAAPVLAVEAPCCMWRRSVRDLASDHMVARRRRCVLRRVKTSRRSNRRGLSPCASAAGWRSRLRGGWHSLVRMLRRFYRGAVCFGHRLISRRSRAHARDAAPQLSEVLMLPAQNDLPAVVPPAPRVVLDPGRAPLPVSAHWMADS